MNQTTKWKKIVKYREKICGCQAEEGWGKDEEGFGC